MALSDQIKVPAQVKGAVGGGGGGALSATDTRNAKHATTGGTSTAYTLTLPAFTLSGGLPLVGTEVSCRLHISNGVAATLNVNGTGDIAIKKFSQGGYVNLSAGFMGTTQVLQFVYTGTWWQLTNVLPLEDNDIPATMSAKTFSGSIFAPSFLGSTGSGAVLRPQSTDGNDIYFAVIHGAGSPNNPGTSQNRGAAGWFYGNEHASFPGVVALCAGDNGSIRLFNSAGTEALSVGASLTANVVSYFTSASGVLADSFRPYSGDFLARCLDNTHCAHLCGGSTTNPTNGAVIELRGASHVTTPNQASYYCGYGTGGQHRFFDKNGSSRLIMNENGVYPQGTGGTGHLLFQTSSNGVVSSRVLATGDMPAQPRLEAIASSGQTTTSNNYITVLYDTPSKNTGPGWSYSAGTWTCLIGGIYRIRAVVFAASSIFGLLAIRKNGTTLVLTGNSLTAQTNLTCDGDIEFAPGDTFQMRAYSSAGTYTIDVTTAGYRELYVQRIA